MRHRIERDPLGESRVPAEAYYGAQTARAVKNFPISGLRAPDELIVATVLVKKAAAEANMSLRRLPRDVGNAIVQAADEILSGVPRSVRGRRLPGGRRNVVQHERERSDCEPRIGDPGRRAGRVRPRPSERPRQHEPVDERRVPDGDAAVASDDDAGPCGGRAAACRCVRAESAHVRAGPEDRTHTCRMPFQ